MNRETLKWLACPFTGSELAIEEVLVGDGDRIETGILRSAGHRFPIVAGIPILHVSSSARQVLSLIERRRPEEALLTLLVPPMPRSLIREIGRVLRAIPPSRPVGEAIIQAIEGRWQQRTAHGILRADRPPTTRRLFASYFCGTGWKMPESFNYFFYRFGQPRHLVGLSFARLVERPQRPVLDLACGAGHLTRYLQMRAASQAIIGVDRLFYLLYVAKKLVAPHGEFICCDAEASLPFPADAFSFVFCSDAFFDFTNKLLCMRELKRVTEADGVIALVWLRNALLSHLYPGRAVPPVAYQSLVADWPHRIIADADVLECYLKKRGCPLESSAPLARLNGEPLLSIVASRREGIFRDYGPFDVWPHGEGRVGLNPLYVEGGQDGSLVRLRLTFPSAFYEQENAECKRYLPDTVMVQSEILEVLRRGERPNEVEPLVDQFVAIGMPERYL